MQPDCIQNYRAVLKSEIINKNTATAEKATNFSICLWTLLFTLLPSRLYWNTSTVGSETQHRSIRLTQPSTLRGTIKQAVTHLYGLRKVVTLVRLTGAAWLAAALACVCRLHVVAVQLAAQVSDEKRIRGVVREMCYTNWHL